MSPFYPQAKSLQAIAAEIVEHLDGDFSEYSWTNEFSNLQHLVDVAYILGNLAGHDDPAAYLDGWIADARIELEESRSNLVEEGA